MPHHETRTVTGKVTHVFGHRFVVKTTKGDVLADLTPHGLDAVSLRRNDTVTLEGEMKPTELKVSRFTRGGKTVEIDHHHHGHHHHHHHEHEPADPDVAVKSARKAGFKVLGSPRRKPKHFEVLGVKKGDAVELHIELDGHIRKTKPVDETEVKWSRELRELR